MVLTRRRRRNLADIASGSENESMWSSTPRASAARGLGSSVDDDHPPRPQLAFSHQKYGEKCKFSTRCELGNMMEVLRHLNRAESAWFENHPQFQHIWHMEKPINNKLQGLWMLLLRTASTDKRKMAWFVVNGVPIRYSLREHALISGLDCHEYPSWFTRNWQGGFTFVERVFGRRKPISVKDVEEKLMAMEGPCGGDRLQMAVLYFLGAVIYGRRKKYGGSIDSRILSLVDDLDVCTAFPWGRLSFEDNIEEIYHLVDQFNGVVKSQWVFAGFVVSLERLVFEAIPALSSKYQDDVDAQDDCPRMCKKVFKGTGVKGFSLEELNDTIGDTKDIFSILEASEGEKDMLLDLMEGGSEDIDWEDPMVKSWNKRLELEQKKIWWEDLFKLDVAGRKGRDVEEVEPQPAQSPPPEPREPQPAHSPPPQGIPPPSGMEDLKELLLSAMKSGFADLGEKVDGIEKRLQAVEYFVSCAKDANEPGFGNWEGEDVGQGMGEKEDQEMGEKEDQEMGEKEDQEKAEDSHHELHYGAMVVYEPPPQPEHPIDSDIPVARPSGHKRTKRSATKKCGRQEKRKVRPSRHVQTPFTTENAKKKKKQKK